jgi:hypothetical protein
MARRADRIRAALGGSVLGLLVIAACAGKGDDS